MKTETLKEAMGMVLNGAWIEESKNSKELTLLFCPTANAEYVEGCKKFKCNIK